MKKIIFPEGNNEFIKEAAEQAKQQEICEPILLDGRPEALKEACEIVAGGEADGMVAGVDFSSRDVILAVRDHIGVQPGVKTFSSFFAIEFPDSRKLILSDGAACKNPTAAQLAEIIRLVVPPAEKFLKDEAKVALLSFSTLGSGGKDHSIDKLRETLSLVRANLPNLKIDGEMQLDAAINPRVAAKKAPDSPVAGRANTLITPDLNSGNLLYKSLEAFAGASVYGPVLLGFNAPVSDLSRGSSIEDILGTIKIVAGV
jgi:phosphate acetyltransferase